MANKTLATDAPVAAYLSAIDDGARRDDCKALAALMAKATGEPATMWGSSIVGFGTHRYKYESGREGETCLLGFASRKGDISVYGLIGSPGQAELLAQLGRHKAGKGCLYIRSMADIDTKVLEKLLLLRARSAESAG